MASIIEHGAGSAALGQGLAFGFSGMAEGLKEGVALRSARAKEQEIRLKTRILSDAADLQESQRKASDEYRLLKLRVDPNNEMGDAWKTPLVENLKELDSGNTRIAGGRREKIGLTDDQADLFIRLPTELQNEWSDEIQRDRQTESLRTDLQHLRGRLKLMSQEGGFWDNGGMSKEKVESLLRDIEEEIEAVEDGFKEPAPVNATIDSLSSLILNSGWQEEETLQTISALTGQRAQLFADGGVLGPKEEELDWIENIIQRYVDGDEAMDAMTARAMAGIGPAGTNAIAAWTLNRVTKTRGGAPGSLESQGLLRTNRVGDPQTAPIAGAPQDQPLPSGRKMPPPGGAPSSSTPNAGASSSVARLTSIDEGIRVLGEGDRANDPLPKAFTDAAYALEELGESDEQYQAGLEALMSEHDITLPLGDVLEQLPQHSGRNLQEGKGAWMKERESIWVGNRSGVIGGLSRQDKKHTVWKLDKSHYEGLGYSTEEVRDKIGAEPPASKHLSKLLRLTKEVRDLEAIHSKTKAKAGAERDALRQGLEAKEKERIQMLPQWERKAAKTALRDRISKELATGVLPKKLEALGKEIRRVKRDLESVKKSYREDKDARDEDARRRPIRDAAAKLQAESAKKESAKKESAKKKSAKKKSAKKKNVEDKKGAEAGGGRPA